MKKVLSLAIAAALVAPAAAMADATLFGKAHFIIQNSPVKTALTTSSLTSPPPWAASPSLALPSLARLVTPAMWLPPT
ncbi:MAG: hypothetical protein P8Z77_06315 [Candidatus Thiodiazotropha sp.]